MCEFIPPFCVMPIDVDKKGKGPVEKDKKHKTVYHVWNAIDLSLGFWDDRKEAEKFSMALNWASNHRALKGKLK